MKVKNEIESIESKTVILIVSNVWNKDKCVQLQIGQEIITVIAEDLRKAIDNSVNNERH